MATRLVEFKSKREYEKWLEKVGSKARVVNVATTKRWSPWSGFLGDRKTYTVTYEQDDPAEHESRSLIGTILIAGFVLLLVVAFCQYQPTGS
jgi:hypothetical protein